VEFFEVLVASIFKVTFSDLRITLHKGQKHGQNLSHVSRYRSYIGHCGWGAVAVFTIDSLDNTYDASYLSTMYYCVVIHILSYYLC
jgi:hypothetical protein